MEDRDTRYRSRKFRIAVGVLCSSAVFLAAGFITGQEWVYISASVLGLYGASNVGEYLANK